MDRFGESFTMKFEGGKTELKSMTGAIFSILLIIILLGYTALKVDNLIRRSQVDIISAINEDFYKQDHQIGAMQGFNFAVALGSIRNGGLDPRIGEFIFTASELDLEQTEAWKIFKERKLEHHICSDEELGKIPTENKKLMPMREI